MATETISYASKGTLTITLASLATNSTFVGGQESTQVDNSSNLYSDATVEGFISVGTTPTAGEIQIWVYGSFHTSVATTNIDTLDGADSAETFTSIGVRDGAVKFGARLIVDSTTSNVKYAIAPFSVAELFGGSMPKFWGVWVTHNTVAALNSTGGNHEISYTGIKYDIA